jgi:hypothetical protein
MKFLQQDTNDDVVQNILGFYPASFFGKKRCRVNTQKILYNITTSAEAFNHIQIKML